MSSSTDALETDFFREVDFLSKEDKMKLQKNLKWSIFENLRVIKGLITIKDFRKFKLLMVFMKIDLILIENMQAVRYSDISLFSTNPLIIKGHWCPKQRLQRLAPPAVMPSVTGALEINYFCRKRC